MARTGALAHVKVLAQASGTGVWLADITARAAGLKPGDSLRVDGLQSFSHPSSPHLRVKGIYRALAHSAETDYWANFYQDIYPQCLDCGIPSPFAFVDETSLFHLLAGRNAGLENIVELPVDPNGVTLADARTLNRKFDAVRNELRRSALGEKLGCSRLAARSQCRAISSLSAAVILADRNASAVTPAVTLLADLGTGIALAVSVRENVEYPVRLAGGDYARAQLLLERLGLAELAERPPQETSIGQQQRTALARALVLEPAVLLADEPTSHQDAGWRDAVWHVLVEAADAGTSCLIATHEEQIADYATRVWKVDSGVVTSS